MKDLQSLVSHPSIQGAQMIVLETGKQIILVRGSERSGLGKPLTNQQITGLLKASLAEEAVSGFQWGKTLDADLLVGDRRLPMRVTLRSDKSFHVEIELEPKRDPTMDTLQPGGAVEKPDELDDDVMEELVAQLTRGENLGLIYFEEFPIAARVEQAVTQAGFVPRKSNQAAAVLEALKYHRYPLFVIQASDHFRRDPVYASLVGMSMELRRGQFSVLLTPSMKTGDEMLAFSLSVHMVLATDAVGELPDRLSAEMARWKRATVPFHEFLEAAGRL